MTFKRIASVTFILGLALALSGAGQQSPEQLYKSGLYEEEVGGNLQKAIGIFQDIVKRFPESREIAAKALLRIGLCYEKLGLKQATEAFQTIVEKYPDQTETVSLAREKLAVLMKTGSLAAKSDQGLKISLLWQDKDTYNTGEISPDGRYLPYYDWTTDDLAVRDMATGKVRRLTNKEGARPGSWEGPVDSIWAPDSREIAYTWYVRSWYGEKPDFLEIRVIALDGSKPRTLYRGDLVKDWIKPCDWSPDGQNILAIFTRGRDSLKPSKELGLVSLKDGSVRYLEAARGVDLGSAKISPDGLHIVFDHGQKANPTKNDLSVIPVAGKDIAAVVDHPADDRLLGWAPDGKSVLFLSDRTGTWDAWMIPVVDEKPQGPPSLIRRELGMVKALGLTRAGALYYSTPGFVWDIFSIPIDPDSGRLLEGPQKLRLPHEGYNLEPSLSPDGDRLAYLSLRGPGLRNYVLCVFYFKSGETREVPLQGNFRRGFWIRDWMPDGRSILLFGDEMDQGAGLFKVDVETGDVTLLLRDLEFYPKDEQGVPETSNAQISRDGRSVYYLFQGPDKSCRVMNQRLDSKETKEICRLPTFNPHDENTLRLSPDGLRLALLLCAGENVRSLKIFPASGGETSEIHRFELRDRFALDMRWSPDSRYIYFVNRVYPNDTDGASPQLWRVPAAGGTAQDLRLGATIIRGLNIYPDGKRIFFYATTAEEQVGAVWVMENFLPDKK